MLLENDKLQTAPPHQWFVDKIYWLKKLSSPLPQTNFIPDFVRDSQASDRSETVSWSLPPSTSQYLLAFTQGKDLALYLFLVAGAKILLHKYSGDRDLLVGSPRIDPDAAAANLGIVPLRSQLGEKQRVSDYLKNLQETIVGAYSHDRYDLPTLERLVGATRSPLFDIAIALENLHGREALTALGHDVTIAAKTDSEQIWGTFTYTPSRFRESTVQLAAHHYQCVLEAIAHHPHQRIADVNLLAGTEKQQILETFQPSQKEYPVDRALHQLFEEQAARRSSHIAAIDRNERLTYETLNQRANQYARLLQEMGVAKGSLVGIYGERSCGFLVAMLATLKAGGAYVPLDSSYPAERIEHMLADSEAPILFVATEFLPVVGNLERSCPHLRCVICWDVYDEQENRSCPSSNSRQRIQIRDRRTAAAFSWENLASSIYGSDLAYVLYTSGSTGTPKGAAIRHGSAINHIYAQYDALGLGTELTFLQNAPASSDISVWQFWAPILAGGTTVIADTETTYQPQKLFQMARDFQLTLMELVPTVLRGVLDYTESLPAQARSLPHLQWMMVTGESVSVELVNRWLRTYPHIGVANAYGPTEAADDIVQATFREPLPENQRIVPIGQPLANLNVWVLDGDENLAPIGVPGELGVAGYGVGMGYWNNPEQTRQSFIPTPFASTVGPLPGVAENLTYKTGDLARWLPDGSLEFLGRIDRQVKIRGFRIELSEIEAILSKHAAVRDSAVVDWENERGEKSLVAYIVPHREELSIDGVQGTGSLEHRVQSFLQQKLPAYMVPVAFVTLEALPLTPNGKIDRQVLPLPEAWQTTASDRFVLPRGEIEEVLARLWGQILECNNVGVEDSFFELGGHSLLATQLVWRIREAFRVEVPLRQLFETPTVAQFAQYLIANEVQSGRTKKIARLLKKVEGMSPEEAQQLLENKKTHR